tara:strand:+ start:457 stop:1677 length:1221 start_codon:yes stop_codon:yes gene_type:complete
MKNLHVFTNKFPFVNSGEDTFLIPEMTFLSREFNIIFYVKKRSEILENLSFKYEICNNFRYVKKNKTRLSFTLIKLMIKEFFYNPRIILSISDVKELMVVLSDNIENSNTFSKYLKSKTFNLNQDFFYTYWFDEWNNILCITKLQNSYFEKFKLISRAHGFDLYNYRSKFNKIPFRANQLKFTDKIVAVSYDGFKYLKKNHKSFADKFRYNRLGTNFVDFNPHINSNTLVVVSCSSIVEIKRIDRIVNLLSLLKINVEWYHFGNGPSFEEIKASTKILKKNISVNFMGQLPNFEVLKFYCKTPINLFINLSDHEGVPVSIMEAISFSIPVIATNVGGVSEIVNKQTGLLFDKDLDLNEIAMILDDFPKHEIFSSKFRNKVYDFWKNNYDTSLNTKSFSNIITDTNN